MILRRGLYIRIVGYEILFLKLFYTLFQNTNSYLEKQLYKHLIKEGV